MKAFPTEHPIMGMMDLKSDGMDLRDYFAAKALQGIVDSSVEAGLETTQIADSAYRIADAMMKARNE
jgi:hypothetical protein